MAEPTPPEPASVIVATYNDADILELSLAAFARQSFQGFELVFADDGSSEDYGSLQGWSGRFVHGIAHVWHEKRGFRRARILNRAIRASRFNRIIFLDLDCLPQRHYVRNHLRYLQPGTAITGRRVHVHRDAVRSAPETLSRGLGLALPHLVWLALRGKARVVEHGFVAPILYESRVSSVLGSNLSVWRSDLEAVNGFNEEFQGWGFEDTDLEERLRLSGVRIRNLRNKVIQYHLSHAQRRMLDDANAALLQKAAEQREVRAARGLAEISDNDFCLRRYGPLGAK